MLNDKELIEYFERMGLKLSLPDNYVHVISHGEDYIEYQWDLWIDNDKDFALVLCDKDFPEVSPFNSMESRNYWLNSSLYRIAETAKQRVDSDNVFRDFI